MGALRTPVKWGGAVVTVLLLTAWIGSGWWGDQWNARAGGHVSIHEGRLLVAEPLFGDRRQGMRGLYFQPRTPEWDLSFDWRSGANGLYTATPLWLPTLAALLVTTAAWRTDVIAARRARLGACASCGYDRAGLAPASACPECGGSAIAP